MASKLKYKTSQGKLQYPWLNKPDTKFNEEGVYKTSISVKPEDAKDLIASIQEFAKDELGKKAEKGRLPFKKDDTTGEIIFNMKSRYAPKLVDSKGNPIVGDIPQVWGGTIAKVKGDVFSYDKGANYGVGMTLLAVQLIELAESTGGDSEGFEAVEGGYVASASSSSSDSDATDNDGYDF